MPFVMALVNTVPIRASRNRGLRSHMVRDGFTGLFNHSRTAEQLRIELTDIESLSCARIEIDKFISVNDNYRHAAGDQVIKSLARLLKQSPAKTDMAGVMGVRNLRPYSAASMPKRLLK